MSRNNLQIESNTVEQVMKYKYIHVKTNSHTLYPYCIRIEHESTTVIDYLRGTIFINKYTAREGKVKLYKVVMRPILMCTFEIRAMIK